MGHGAALPAAAFAAAAAVRRRAAAAAATATATRTADRPPAAARRRDFYKLSGGGQPAAPSFPRPTAPAPLTTGRRPAHVLWSPPPPPAAARAAAFPGAPYAGTRNASAFRTAEESRKEYFAKYQEKLKKKSAAEGVSSVEDLLARRRQAERAEAGEHREAERGSAPGQNNLDRASGRSKTPPPAEPGPVSSPSGVKALRHILDLDKIRSSGISGDDIGNMWTAYHATKPNVLSAVIPVKVYEVLMARAKEFPMFILPVPGRSASEYELYVLQWSFASCYLTSLAEFKAAGAEAARPHLTLTHHGELAKEKGIVLMRGEITEGGGGSGAGLVSAANAHLLAMLVQRFYGGVTGGPRARALLETFHRRPAEFSVDELVADASSLCQK